MLLGSPAGYNGHIELFPTWPRDEPASFTKLRAKGGFLVSANWNNVTLRAENLTVVATSRTHCVIKNPWPAAAVGEQRGVGGAGRSAAPPAASTVASVQCNGKAIPSAWNGAYLSFEADVGVPCSVSKGDPPSKQRKLNKKPT